MDKPLKDWTLGEVKAYCKKHGTCGKECRFFVDVHERCALIRKDPETWALTEAPPLTQDELTVLRLLKAAGAVLIKKGDTTSIYCSDENGFENNIIPSMLLPSLREGDELDLTTMKLD